MSPGRLEMDMTIDGERLRRDLEELGRIGRDERGGVSRPSFSPADLEARAWLKGKIEEAGLCYRQDGAGNQFGRLECAPRTVMAGSHIDTVPHGGMFDGAAGVLAALEAVRRVAEEKVPLQKALEVASFTDEEGNLVGDFLGSRAFVGLLDEAEVRGGRTSFGLPFAEILKKTPFTAESILSAHRSRPVDRTAPVAVAPRLVALLEEECRTLGYPSMRVTSGAGHDAQILAGVCDAGMIFIPSPDGISHAPEERVDWDALEKGANVLLRALIKLAA